VLGKKKDGIQRIKHLPIEQRLLGLFRIMILVALILGAVAASSISGEQTAAKASSIKSER
jgi:hypothetical protein